MTFYRIKLESEGRTEMTEQEFGDEAAWRLELAQAGYREVFDSNGFSAAPERWEKEMSGRMVVASIVGFTRTALDEAERRLIESHTHAGNLNGIPRASEIPKGFSCHVDGLPTIYGTKDNDDPPIDQLRGRIVRCSCGNQFAISKDILESRIAVESGESEVIARCSKCETGWAVLVRDRHKWKETGVVMPLI